MHRGRVSPVIQAEVYFFLRGIVQGYNENYSGGRLPLPSWRRLHSAKTEKIRHPGQSALYASFVRSLRGPAFGARKLLAVFLFLTPL